MIKIGNDSGIAEAITFSEFVQYGKGTGCPLVKDMPWSFKYKGLPITHENDECYLILRGNETLQFTPNDLLITSVDGTIYVFPKAVSGLDFGEAVRLMKRGARIARLGWNGKGMWVFIIQGSNDIAKLHGYGFGEYQGEPTFRDAMFLRTADNQLVPWTVSQSDALAEDWMVL